MTGPAVLLGAVDLEDACREAVQAGDHFVGELVLAIEDLVEALDGTQVQPFEGALSEPTAAVLTADAEEFASVIELLLDAGRMQSEEAHHVNIVLFGRTNVGKSTLITALTREDGSEVSRGDSDCTKDAATRFYGHLSVTDTPGIGGPGLELTTEVLEGRAADALARADVVLLCLDSINFTDDTVESVARLVVAHGKPVVVVLNARNPRWGRRGSVTDLRERRRLSREIAVHAEHAAQRLHEVGLAHVPIVVVQAGLAMYARAAEPYAGPFPAARAAVLREAGNSDNLVAWSNLPALENLLAEGLRAGAALLRRQARVYQLAGTVRHAGVRFGALCDQAEPLIEQHEAGIVRVLDLVGTPGSLQRLGLEDTPLQAVRRCLETLEDLRGEPLPISGQGSVQTMLNSLVTVHLSALRTQALRRGDDVIDGAIRARRNVQGDVFWDQVLPRSEVDAVLAEIGTAFAGHVEEGLGLIAAEVRQDIKTELPRGSGVGGRSARRTYITGMSLGIASPALSTAGFSILAATALSNAWNPVGWALIGVGAVLSPVGLWLRRRSERQRNQQLSAARGGVRRAVNQYLDDVGSQTVSSLMAICADVLVSRVGPAVQAAVALRELQDCQRRRVKVITEFEAKITALASGSRPGTGSGSVLVEAARTCELSALDGPSVAGDLERRPAVDEQSRRDLWWGEGWCRETTRGCGGLQVIRHDGLVREGVQSAVERFLACLNDQRDTRARQWLESARARLAADPMARRVLRDIGLLEAATAARVVLCGDYNTGKSAFLARVCRELELPVPASLHSGAGVTTQHSSSHRIGDLLLVDTPGFQAGNARHRQRARAELQDAALVLHLFSPSGITGDLSDALEVLMPTGASGAAVASSTLFVLNRAENLGLDPHDSPNEFLRLLQLKEEELALTLARRLEVPPQDLHIVSVASAPYGDPDAGYAWDGMAQVATALSGPVALAAAARLSAVRGGTARLVALMSRTVEEQQRDRRRRERVARLAEVLRRAVDTERVFVEERTQHLVRAVDELIADLLDTALADPSQEVRAAAVERLASLSGDQELAAVVEHWTAQTGSSAAGLRQRLDEQILRLRIRARARYEGRTPLGGGDPGATPTPLSFDEVARTTRRWFDVARAMIAPGGQALAQLGRAGRLAESASGTLRIARAGGAVLGAVTIIADVAGLVHEYRSGKRTEEARTELFHRLRERAAEWSTAQAESNQTLRGIQRHSEELERMAEKAAKDLESIEERIRETDQRVRVCQELIEGSATIYGEGADDGDG